MLARGGREVLGGSRQVERKFESKLLHDGIVLTKMNPVCFVQPNGAVAFGKCVSTKQIDKPIRRKVKWIEDMEVKGVTVLYVNGYQPGVSLDAWRDMFTKEQKETMRLLPVTHTHGDFHRLYMALGGKPEHMDVVDGQLYLYSGGPSNTKAHA